MEFFLKLLIRNCRLTGSCKNNTERSCVLFTQLACSSLGRCVGGLEGVVCLGSHRDEMKVLARLGFYMEDLRKMILPGSFSCWQNLGGNHTSLLGAGLWACRWFLCLQSQSSTLNASFSLTLSYPPPSATEEASSFKGSPGWVRPAQIISVF